MKKLYKIIFFFVLIINSGGILNAKTADNKAIEKKVLATSATISGTTAVCQNSASPLITFTGSGGTAPYTFTYRINSGALQTVSSTGTNSTITVSAPTSATGTFTYTLVSVHDATLPVAEITQTGAATITVGSPPTVNFTFTNDNTCSGTTMQFNSSVTGSGSGTILYSWNFGDGTALSNLQNPSHQFTALGCGTSTFTVTLTITVNGCTAVRTQTITVKQKPDINFTDLNNPFDPFNNCSNAATNPVFSVNVGNPTPPACIAPNSYTIDWGDGSPVVNNASFPAAHTYNLVGAYNMVITALGTNGCSNSMTYVIKNVTNPSGGIVSPGSTQNLCAPSAPLNFTISNWGGNSLGTLYNIDYGDGSPLVQLTQADLQSSAYYNASNPAASQNFPIPHSYTISNCPSPRFTALLTVSNACGETPSSVSNITVYAKPVANFTAPAQACSNTNVAFTNTTLTGYNQNCVENAIYDWNFGDGTPNSALTNPTHAYTAPGNYTITLIARGYCGFSDPITRTICIEAPLTPSFTLDNTAGCMPLAVTASNTTVETNSCTPPTYLWTVAYAAANCGTTASIPNQTTKNASFNFTEPGTYTITLTATNSCGTFVSSQTVTVKRPPTITSINGINANYCGPVTLNPTATVNSCAPASSTLTYAWSFPGGIPATSNTAIPGAVSYTAPGNYTVALIVTNECGASVTATRNFTINEIPVLANTSLTQTICSGSATALVNLTSNPAGAAFTWTATATTGISGFTPSGTNTIPVQTILTTNTSSGTVTYSITPSLGGCPGTPVDYVITVNPAPSITDQPVSSTVCLGGNPSVLSFTISGTTGTPTYQWYSNTVNLNTGGTLIPGETNASYTPPSATAGTIYYYCVISLPTGGCSNITTNTAAVTITPNTTITTQPTPSQNLCVGSIIPSPLTIAHSGGTGTVSYEWYFNTVNSNTGGTLLSGAVTNSYTPSVYTSPGNYYYYVTISSNGSGCLPITSNVAEVVVFADPTISSQPIASQTLCQNAVPLNLDVTAAGGNGTFSYQWYSNSVNSNTGGTLITGAVSNSYTPPTNAVGTNYYYCEVSQSTLGCSVTSTVSEIIIISAPTITQPVSSTVCLGGTPTPLSITVSGATGTPQYQWYSNTVNNTTTGTAISGETTNNFNPPSTAVGTIYYYCIITLPSGGCSSITSNTANVTITPGASIDTQPTALQNLCVGASVPAPLTIAYSGGTGTPSYQWFSNTVNANTGGTSISGATNASYTPPVFTAAGSYYYYVTVTLSGNGCGPITSNPAEIVITADPVVTAQPLASQTICQNTASSNLSVTASGGISAPYNYQWFSNTTNNNTSGTAVSGAVNNTFTPPAATVGTTYYYCEITQTTGSGCNVTSNTAAVIVNLAPTFSSQPVSSTICIGQTPSLLSVSYINGVGTPQYQWYSNSIDDTTTGTLIPGAVSATYNPQNTTAGTVYYYCIITLPTGGCSSLTSNTANVTINQNPVIANKTDIICSGKPFAVTPDTLSGDIIPAGTTYTWSNPSISPAGSITGASAESAPQTSISQTLTNSTTSPATVTYSVTPLSGNCPGTPFSITVTVNPSISPNVTQNNISCFGANNGSLQTNITGGIPFGSGAPYQIAWTGPNGFTSSAANISNLVPGTYNLSITDAGGCPINENYIITEPADIVITTDLKKDITCFGTANGEIAITINGGTLNYTIAWRKNGNPYQAAEDLTNLGPGLYEVTVSDANNCGPKTTSFTIIEPPLLTVSLANQTNILCFGQATGVINTTIAGGTSPYTYAWTGPNGFTSSAQNLTALFAGTYNLTVTDSFGCSKNLPVTLTQTPEIIITATTTPITCYGDNNASISLAISGGVSPYQIGWSNLGSGTFQNNLSAGAYLITVTDALNCVQTLNVNIPDAPLFTVNPVVKNISCFGANNGSIALNFVGGVGTPKLTWNDGAVTGTTRNNLKKGTYTVTIVDSQPCTIVRTFVIIEPQELSLSANLTNALDCNDANTGAINLLVSGGTPPFTYAWSNGAVTEDLAAIPAGNYLVTVTDANGCTKQEQYSITRPAPLTAAVITSTDFDCDTKYVKQTFTANVSGGLPPYQLSWSSGTVSGANHEIMNTNQNGTVILNVTDAMGCKTNHPFVVDTPELGTPSFNASSYGYSAFGIYSINDPIQFTNTATGDYTGISWDFGDGTYSTEINPTHKYVNPKDYVVTQTVTYPFGCVYVHKITLSVDKGYVLVLPTAFTPNTDNLNDFFRPVAKTLKNIRLDIYDTWGSLIYSETGDVLKGWDGKIKGFKAENGNYYCKVSGETFYGTTVNENHPFVLIK